MVTPRGPFPAYLISPRRHPGERITRNEKGQRLRRCPFSSPTFYLLSPTSYLFTIGRKSLFCDGGCTTGSATMSVAVTVGLAASR